MDAPQFPRVGFRLVQYDQVPSPVSHSPAKLFDFSRAAQSDWDRLRECIGGVRQNRSPECVQIRKESQLQRGPYNPLDGMIVGALLTVMAVLFSSNRIQDGFPSAESRAIIDLFLPPRFRATQALGNSFKAGLFTTIPQAASRFFPNFKNFIPGFITKQTGWAVFWNLAISVGAEVYRQHLDKTPDHLFDFRNIHWTEFNPYPVAGFAFANFTSACFLGSVSKGQFWRHRVGLNGDMPVFRQPIQFRRDFKRWFLLDFYTWPFVMASLVPWAFMMEDNVWSAGELLCKTVHWSILATGALRRIPAFRFSSPQGANYYLINEGIMFAVQCLVSTFHYRFANVDPNDRY